MISDLDRGDKEWTYLGLFHLIRRALGRIGLPATLLALRRRGRYLLGRRSFLCRRTVLVIATLDGFGLTTFYTLALTLHCVLYTVLFVFNSL
jgi:hypothetical protein